jgi:hypothetical protein
LDEWPSTHSNNEEYRRPFNENLFMIRKHYRTVFHEKKFTPLDELNANQKMDNRKVFKIKYALNMLPSIGVYMDKEYDSQTKETVSSLKNTDKNILELCAGSEEIEMFESEPLQDLVKFKWDSYG